MLLTDNEIRSHIEATLGTVQEDLISPRIGNYRRKMVNKNVHCFKCGIKWHTCCLPPGAAYQSALIPFSIEDHRWFCKDCIRCDSCGYVPYGESRHIEFMTIYRFGSIPTQKCLICWLKIVQQQSCTLCHTTQYIPQLPVKMHITVPCVTKKGEEDMTKEWLPTLDMIIDRWRTPGLNLNDERLHKLRHQMLSNLKLTFDMAFRKYWLKNSYDEKALTLTAITPSTVSNEYRNVESATGKRVNGITDLKEKSIPNKILQENVPTLSLELPWTFNSTKDTLTLKPKKEILSNNIVTWGPPCRLCWGAMCSVCEEGAREFIKKKDDRKCIKGICLGCSGIVPEIRPTRVISGLISMFPESVLRVPNIYQWPDNKNKDPTIYRGTYSIKIKNRLTMAMGNRWSLLRLLKRAETGYYHDSDGYEILQLLSDYCKNLNTVFRNVAWRDPFINDRVEFGEDLLVHLNTMTAAILYLLDMTFYLRDCASGKRISYPRPLVRGVQWVKDPGDDGFEGSPIANELQRFLSMMQGEMRNDDKNLYIRFDQFPKAEGPLALHPRAYFLVYSGYPLDLFTFPLHYRLALAGILNIIHKDIGSNFLSYPMEFMKQHANMIGPHRFSVQNNQRIILPPHLIGEDCIGMEYVSEIIRYGSGMHHDEFLHRLSVELNTLITPLINFHPSRALSTRSFFNSTYHGKTSSSTLFSIHQHSLPPPRLKFIHRQGWISDERSDTSLVFRIRIPKYIKDIQNQMRDNKVFSTEISDIDYMSSDLIKRTDLSEFKLTEEDVTKIDKLSSKPVIIKSHDNIKDVTDISSPTTVKVGPTATSNDSKNYQSPDIPVLTLLKDLLINGSKSPGGILAAKSMIKNEKKRKLFDQTSETCLLCGLPYNLQLRMLGRPVIINDDSKRNLHSAHFWCLLSEILVKTVLKSIDTMIPPPCEHPPRHGLQFWMECKDHPSCLLARGPGVGGALYIGLLLPNWFFLLGRPSTTGEPNLASVTSGTIAIVSDPLVDGFSL